MTNNGNDGVRALFDRYARAWTARDPDAIIALHTPDTMFWLHTGGQAVHGRQKVRDTFAEMFNQWPEFGFDVHRVLIGDDHWILDWALTAVLPSPDNTLKPIRFDCADIVTIDTTGLVTRKDTFVDYTQVQHALTHTP